jgi:hypothetical protein
MFEARLADLEEALAATVRTRPGLEMLELFDETETQADVPPMPAVPAPARSERTVPQRPTFRSLLALELAQANAQPGYCTSISTPPVMRAATLKRVAAIRVPMKPNMP